MSVRVYLGGNGLGRGIKNTKTLKQECLFCVRNSIQCGLKRARGVDLRGSREPRHKCHGKGFRFIPCDKGRPYRVPSRAET